MDVHAKIVLLHDSRLGTTSQNYSVWDQAKDRLARDEAMLVASSKALGRGVLRSDSTSRDSLTRSDPTPYASQVRRDPPDPGERCSTAANHDPMHGSPLGISGDKPPVQLFGIGSFQTAQINVTPSLSLV
jgi:hypothetical protein